MTTSLLRELLIAVHCQFPSDRLGKAAERNEPIVTDSLDHIDKNLAIDLALVS